MHIPQNLLSGPVCPVSAAVAACAVIWSAKRIGQQHDHFQPGTFSVVTASLFALQMFNIPIGNGISAHLLGGFLGALILGVPGGVLSMTIVLILQALLLGDGGWDALGVNVINMAVLGAGVCGTLYFRLRQSIPSRYQTAFVGICAGFSVLLASAGCALGVSLGSDIPLTNSASVLMGEHVLVGILEAMFTAFIFKTYDISNTHRIPKDFSFAAMALSVAALSPWSSSFPDPLNTLAEANGFVETSSGLVATMLHYLVPSAGGSNLFNLIAALLCVVIVAGFSNVSALLLNKGRF